MQREGQQGAARARDELPAGPPAAAARSEGHGSGGRGAANGGAQEKRVGHRVDVVT